MKSYNRKTRKYIKTPKDHVNFLNEIESICKKYNLSISHEDNYGSFIIDEFNDENIIWLKKASVSI